MHCAVRYSQFFHGNTYLSLVDAMQGINTMFTQDLNLKKAGAILLVVTCLLPS